MSDCIGRKKPLLRNWALPFFKPVLASRRCEIDDGATQGARAVDQVVIFDTEFTAWRGSVARGWKGPGEHQEVVQIGAVRIDTKELKERASLSVLIRPIRNPVLSAYFEELTHISNERVAREGVSFAEGVARFLQFAGQYPCFCYGRDDLVISRNAALLGDPGLWRQPPATNLRIWLERVGVPLSGVHSGELAAHVGAAAQGRVHDALADARSLAEATRYLVARGAPNPFAQSVPHSGTVRLLSG
jgi:inhibitor of KinA sporulation pathway (predicted exonuclease)